MAFTRALGNGAPADELRVVAINPGPVGTGRLVMLRRAEAQQKFGDPEHWRELRIPDHAAAELFQATLADIVFRPAVSLRFAF